MDYVDDDDDDVRGGQTFLAKAAEIERESIPEAEGKLEILQPGLLKNKILIIRSSSISFALDQV